MIVPLKWLLCFLNSFTKPKLGSELYHMDSDLLNIMTKTGK